ncbi:hypothetical protein CANMA_003099 [Candida margitis]|uniref:uncharacterized protein n=1 Tax=Candida margitis TaxID=1775924 RepID=UPI002227A752|nr:uncharacterized protein CANMA_003099 [Candida margitis]KAI5967279.1 hypothetical protein CANMA_003099 [Candida margitis]
MPLPTQLKQDILTNAKICLYFILPIALSMYLIPTFITPDLITYIQINFRVILLSKQFCQVKPQQCEVLLDSKFGDPEVLYRQVFHHYDLIYVVNKYIWQWDRLVIKIIVSSPAKYTIIGMGYLRGVEMNDEYWNLMQETLHIILAIFNTSIFHIVMGMVVSRMWMFFIVGVVLTILEPWEKLAGPIWNLLQSANNVF